jgi:hypothetical protein
MNPLRRAILAVTLAFLFLASCSVQSSPPQPQKPAESAPAQGGASAKLNLDEIFPPGRGRELLLNNCTTCHTFVPIVVLQMNKEAWDRNSRDHRGRVGALSDADFKTLYDYLRANFNPNRPVPKLPPELLATWTSY